MNVLQAAQERVSYIFDNFEKIYLCFSGGKDSTVCFHLAMCEAEMRNRKITVLFIDLECQYEKTIDHVEKMFDLYRNNIIPIWSCVKLNLRNSISIINASWTCWDENKIRIYPASCIKEFPFHFDNMEFEDFCIKFGEWFGKSACILGIRTDESLNRELAIKTGWKTNINNVTNCYPIYDWKVSDIWAYSNGKLQNQIYDMMNKAGVPLKYQRICQPFGDEQKQGLWLYHILEKETWSKLLNRVSGVNSGSLYIKEKFSFNKPDRMNWKQYAEFLVNTSPEKTKRHYIERITKFCKSWEKRGYEDGIMYQCPNNIEARMLAPSWRMICRAILKNDYWFRSIGMSQPFSKTYGKYLNLKGRL